MKKDATGRVRVRLSVEVEDHKVRGEVELVLRWVLNPLVYPQKKKVIPVDESVAAKAAKPPADPVEADPPPFPTPLPRKTIDPGELYDEAFRRYSQIAYGVNRGDFSWTQLTLMDDFSKILYRFEQFEILQVIRLLRFACDQGHVPSYKLLGTIYSSGHGVLQSDSEAFLLWGEGARLNDASCQCEIGLRHERGRGVTQNDRAAVVWYRQAAAQNFPRGLYLLGKMTEEGRGGIDRSDIVASRLYQRAAPFNVDAQRRLHQLLHTGLEYYLGWGDLANMATEIISESKEGISSAQRVLEEFGRTSSKEKSLPPASNNTVVTPAPPPPPPQAAPLVEDDAALVVDDRPDDDSLHIVDDENGSDGQNTDTAWRSSLETLRGFAAPFAAADKAHSKRIIEEKETQRRKEHTSWLVNLRTIALEGEILVSPPAGGQGDAAPDATAPDSDSAAPAPTAAALGEMKA